MAAFDLREVEFANDGISDSLTLTMSPALFQDNLKREIASAKRERRELCVISITVRPESFPSLAAFQEALIELAFGLRGGLRGGDFFARVSDSGFWILLRTDESNAGLVIARLQLAHHEDLDIYTVARSDSEFQEWILRIDKLHFQ